MYCVLGSVTVFPAAGLISPDVIPLNVTLVKLVFVKLVFVNVTFVNVEPVKFTLDKLWFEKSLLLKVLFCSSVPDNISTCPDMLLLGVEINPLET